MLRTEQHSDWRSPDYIRQAVVLRKIAPIVLVAVMAAASCPAPAQPGAAQTYPNRPIRFVVPFTPGGSADILARAVAQKMTDAFNQQVVIDNRGGSNGIIGTEIAAKSPPDGYTLVVGIPATFAINPGLYPKLPYDPTRDFTAVTLIASAQYLLLVSPAVPAKTVGELIALAKAKPGQLNYASTGSGSLPHLSMELFKSMAGVNIVHVPYRGAGPALVDLLSGQVQVMALGMVSAQVQVKAGKLRAIAITSPKRSSLMPEVPTVSESGLPGFDVTGWYGVFVPRGTPAAIVTQLQTQIARILRMPDVGARLATEGADVGGNSPEEFAAFVKTEHAKWAKVVKISGARAD